MIKKITLFSLKCLAIIGFSQALHAQQIYTNGGLSTGATTASGVAAPTGYTWSEVQSDTGNTTESNTNAGIAGYYINSLATNFALADDFVVPAGQTWNITSFDFYCYQTNYAGTTPPIDVLRIQIYNGDPSAGGTVVTGNLTTNVYDASNSADALMYRAFNTVTPAPGTAPGTTRRIWRVRGNISATLTAGTYWVVFQSHATSDTAFFFPAETVVGSRTVAGWNAKQLNVTANTWADVLDSGNPATAPDAPQDFPFDINGTVLSTNQNDFDAKVSLSPNPVKDILTVSVPTGVVINKAVIYDLNGKFVKEVNANTTINVSDLAVGKYVLKITSDNGEVAKKFIKE